MKDMRYKMIRQAAFGAGRPLLKGALHCHTTRSDGRGTPEEVIALHAKNGYDFMALTDHRIYNYNNYGDVPMTIIPGMEMDGNFNDEGVHCIHTVSIGPSRKDGNGFEQDQKFKSVTIDDQSEYQPVLDMLHENGNMTIYCHPEWSCTPARDFDRLRGNFAMEIWNSGCAIENEMDTNAPYWDEILMQGQKIYGVATDDGHAMYQHCKGWVMVNAENSISGILEALREGRFYSSCGPEIRDFHIDGGTAVLEFSPCAAAYFYWGRYPTRVIRNAEGQLTRAEFKVPEYFTYLRAAVIDSQGRRAWTNPIFF